MLLARLPKYLVRYRTHVAIVGMFVLLGSFILISMALKSTVLSRYDLWFTTEAQEESSALVRYPMFAISSLGNSLTLFLVAISVAAYLAYKNLKVSAWFAFAGLIGLPIDMALKSVFERPRPGEDLVSVLLPRIGYSFPSGHALGSTTVYGFLAFLAWVHLREHKARRPVAYGLACLPPLISLSRVYVGAHWLSDVVAGMAMGLFVVILMALVYERVAPAARPKPSPESVATADPTQSGAAASR
jgi:undecaprenyl-diphosphatase